MVEVEGVVGGWHLVAVVALCRRPSNIVLKKSVWSVGLQFCAKFETNILYDYNVHYVKMSA